MGIRLYKRKDEVPFENRATFNHFFLIQHGDIFYLSNHSGNKFEMNPRDVNKIDCLKDLNHFKILNCRVIL